MKAISKYKAIVEEVGRMMMIFANTDNVSTLAKYWTLTDIHKAQIDVMNYANTAADKIKDELVGDEAKFRGRLKIAFFELGADPKFAPSFFPVFDEALFELPSKDEPNKNRQMHDALTNIYGDDAADVMVSLQTTAQWANVMVQDVFKMLDDLCSFVGYTPEPQQDKQQPQQKDLQYFCQKAIEKGYLVKESGGYRRADWTKAQLAYFLEHFLNIDGTFPDKEYSLMFGESRLGKARAQLADNKIGDGKPRGYEKVDELLQE